MITVAENSRDVGCSSERRWSEWLPTIGREGPRGRTSPGISVIIRHK